MTNLNKKILDWIGKKKPTILNMLQDDELFNKSGIDGITGYNQALADLRTKAPELEERVLEQLSDALPELIEEYFPKGQSKERGKAIVLASKIISTLTSKE